MELKNNWLIWIPLIILLIFSFPKTCGNTTPSEFVDYSCAGFKAPFLTSIQNSDNPQEWCSGICFSKTKKMIEPNKTEEIVEGPNPFGGLSESFGKVIPVLLLAFIAIGILKFISSLKKKNVGMEIRVYKSP